MDLTNLDDIQSEPTFPKLIQKKWKEKAETQLKLYENVYQLPPAAPMIMLSTKNRRHIFLPDRPTPRHRLPKY